MNAFLFVSVALIATIALAFKRKTGPATSTSTSMPPFLTTVVNAVQKATTTLLPQRPRGIRNNNPLNVRPTSDQWVGATGDDGGYLIFISPEFGIRAAARIIRTYRRKHNLNSIQAILKRWAPEEDNNHTSSYVAFIESKLARDKYALLPSLSDAFLYELLSWMIVFENGENPYPSWVIQRGIEMEHNDKLTAAELAAARNRAQ